jgi:hypothetical protein
VKITPNDLDGAVARGILSADQARALTDYLCARPSQGARFDFTHILYYLGGLIAIGAMSLFMNLGWESFGGWGILFLSLAYAVGGLLLANWFERNGFPVPAGICATFVVVLTPLAIYGLQQGMGWWPAEDAYRDYHRYIRWHWLFLELGTLAVGAVMVWRYRYPFLLMPVAVTLWYLSMDLAVMLMAGSYDDWAFRADFSLWFGLAMILGAFWVDVRSRASADYAFWLYLFGVLTFWGGLSAQGSDSEVARLLYCLINLGLIATGALLSRRVFVVFGALGVTGYIGHLSWRVFADSWLFPFALTFIGLGIVFLGVLWQRHEAHITAHLRALLPQPVRELLSARAAQTG